MKKELPHFYIGNSYGGNQEWFKTFMMRLGGCGAETACDASLYFAREFGMPGSILFAWTAFREMNHTRMLRGPCAHR